MTTQPAEAPGANRANPYFRRRVLLRLLLYALLFLPMIAGFVARDYVQMRQIAEAESYRDTRNLAHAFAEEVGSTVRAIDMSLITLRTHWQHNRADFRGVVDELNVQLRDRIIFQVSVTDARGMVQFTTGKNQSPIDLGDREHIRVHLDGGGRDRLFISKPMIGRTNGVWSVQFTRPIIDAEGRVAGVLIASVEPVYFLRFYSSIDLGEGASVGLGHMDGVLLARSAGTGANYFGREVSGEPFEPGGALAGNYRRHDRIDGVERFFGWRKLPDYGLVVTVGQDVDDAYARYAGQQRATSLLGAAVALAVILLAWTALANADNRRLAVKALARAETRWKLALTAANAGVWDWNVRTGSATLAPRAQSILNAHSDTVSWSRHALEGMLFPDDVPDALRAMNEHFAGRTADFAVECRVAPAGGAPVWVMLRGLVVERDDAGIPVRVVGTVTNIEDRKSREEQVRYQASHDPLTGLANRALFNDRLAQAILLAFRDKASMAVIYFDLDRFKPVNDTHGHAVGDGVLVDVGRRITAKLRQSDTLARLGGDEFAVLLPRCASRDDAVKVAETILALLEEPFHVAGLELHISCSIGVALYPDCGDDADSLVACADRAMYNAKQNGRNQVSVAGD